MHIFNFFGRRAGSRCSAALLLFLLMLLSGSSGGGAGGVASPSGVAVASAVSGGAASPSGVAVASASGVSMASGVAGGAASATSPRGVWPVDAPHLVLRAFEAPATPYSAGHRGIDIAAAPGQPVYAILAGTVSFAGVVVDRPLVSITHADGLVSAVEPVTPNVALGQSVAAGEQIGIVTAAGHCDLGCVHLGLRLRGEYVSPMLLLGTVPRAVLLPLSSG